MPENPPPLQPRTILAIVMGALVLWAVYVAIGVLWYEQTFLGALIVLVCMAMFLGFWLLLLRSQKRDKQE